tara:strand:+ start:4044 stop:4604 length:561 start_codon:yes stop_codon:yes gene_type:complete
MSYKPEHLTKKEWIAVVQWINMRWSNADLTEDKVKELYDDFKFFGEDVVWRSMNLYYENGNSFMNIVDLRKLCQEQYAEVIKERQVKALTVGDVAELNAGGLLEYLKMNGYESFAHAVYDVKQKRVKAGKPFLDEGEFIDAELPYEQAKDSFLQTFSPELTIEQLESRRAERDEEKPNTKRSNRYG